MGRFSQVPTSSSSSYTSMSSTGRRSGSTRGFPKKCFCGLDPVMRTSTTAENPGRRFYGCRNYQDSGYHLMKWWDEALMEEFMDVSLTVDQICEKIDHSFLYFAEDVAVTKLHEELQKTQEEVAQLKELLTEQPSGERKKHGSKVQNLVLAGVVLFVLMIYICVCL